MFSVNSKGLAALVIVGLVIVAVVAIIYAGNPVGKSQGNSYISTSTPAVSQNNVTNILFANTQYYQFAYLVSSGNLSSQAQAALSGFNVSRTVYSNGTTLIGIALNGNGNRQLLYLKPGYKLYMIETSFGDDSFGGESNLGDDGFVEVSSSGYIVQ